MHAQKVFALALLLLCGCLKEKRVVTIYPDGSGKVEFTCSREMKSAPGATAFDWVSENSKGITAWSTKKEQRKEGWYSESFTGYFENVNHVALPGLAWSIQPDVEVKPTRFTLERGRGTDCHLTIKNPQVSAMFINEEAIDSLGSKKRKGAIDFTRKEHWKGFEFSEEFYFLSKTMENVSGGVVVTADDFFQSDGTRLDKSFMRGRLKHNETSHQIQARDISPPASFVKEFNEAKKSWRARLVKKKTTANTAP